MGLIKLTNTHSEHQSIITNKQLLLKCFVAEEKFAKFLLECVDRHGSTLTEEELFTTKEMTDLIYSILGQIGFDEKPPPDKLTVYPSGGVSPRYGVFTQFWVIATSLGSVLVRG